MRQLVNPFTFGRPCLKLALFGCTNRPFYRIVVFPDKRLGRWYEGNILEQVSYCASLIDGGPHCSILVLYLGRDL